MLSAYLFEKLFGRSCAPGLDVFKTFAKRCDCVLEILCLPGQGLFERFGRILPMPLGRGVELRLPVRGDRNHFHI
jgi:hypothetical protein